MLFVICFFCGLLSRRIVGVLSLGSLVLIYGVFAFLMPELAKSGGHLSAGRWGEISGEAFVYFVVLIIGHLLRRLIGFSFGRRNRKKLGEVDPA